jgi:sulfide:quinone oxidoreductase
MKKMEQHEFEYALKMLDVELDKKGMSRRDALKLAGLGTASFLLTGGGQEAEAATTAHASDVQGKIVIVGGGLAGISTAVRLTNYLSNPDITIIEPEKKSVSYQPGQTLIGAGVWEKEEIIYENSEFIPNGAKLINDKAISFDPDNNSLTTQRGQTITYDILIIAAGVKMNFGAIKGLEAAGEAYSAGDNSALVKTLNDAGVSSIYTADGAEATWKNMQTFIADAATGKKVNGVFTHPDTAIKCGGAPKKIMFLTDARLRETKGARENATLTFYPNGSKMFGVPEYHDALVNIFEDRDLKWNYQHNLVAIDGEKRIATFDKRWMEQGEWDPDYEEYDQVEKHEMIDIPYDFIHVTPPMKVPDEIGNSALGSNKGWVLVDYETLQHKKFDNVFALGDIAAIPLGKTGGSVRKQYKVVVDNVIAKLENRPLEAKYDGYTVCPLLTSLSTVMLAEFDWTNKPTPSFPLDPTKERWLWWLLKVYALKPMTVIGMLSTGRA